MHIIKRLTTDDVKCPQKGQLILTAT